MEQRPPGNPGLMTGDSWSNWDPDPDRAFREHDPALEPFASMSRVQILERMQDAKGGREWEFLREYLLDRCSPDELRPDTFHAMLKAAMGLGYEEFCLLFEDAGPATRLAGAGPGVDSSRGRGIEQPVSREPTRTPDP